MIIHFFDGLNCIAAVRQPVRQPVVADRQHCELHSGMTASVAAENPAMGAADCANVFVRLCKAVFGGSVVVVAGCCS